MGYMAAVGVPCILALSRWGRARYALSADEQRVFDERLRAHVAWMADRIGMEPPASRIGTDALFGAYYASASKGEIVISVGVLDDFAPAEVDFLVAHELAHLRLGHLRERWAITWAPAIVFPFAVGICVAARHLFAIAPWTTYIPAILVFVGMTLYERYVRRVMQRHTIKADRLALETTRNREAAISAIQKLGLQTPLAEAGDHAPALPNPARDARIQALSAIE